MIISILLISTTENKKHGFIASGVPVDVGSRVDVPFGLTMHSLDSGRVVACEVSSAMPIVLQGLTYAGKELLTGHLLLTSNTLTELLRGLDVIAGNQFSFTVRSVRG